MFDASALEPIASQFEDPACVSGCETRDWSIQAVQLPLGYQPTGTDETLFTVTGKFPQNCGAGRSNIAALGWCWSPVKAVGVS